MSFSAEFDTTPGGTRILVFFRNRKEWHADLPVKDQRFSIGAQMAYFLCAYRDRLVEFVDKEGKLPHVSFPEKVILGRGHVREVCWHFYTDFEIQQKEMRKPFLKAVWSTERLDGEGRGFGVEKVRAVIACWVKVSEFASTYGSEC